MFGGRRTEPLSDLWVYDTGGGRWSKVEANNPAARFGANAVYDRERRRFVVFGGQAGADFFNDVWAFDPEARLWTQLSPGEKAPAERYGAAGALDSSGGLVVSHGFTHSGRFDDTWRLGLAPSQLLWEERTPQGALPVERCLMRGAWDPLGSRFLMFGGQTNDNPFLGDLWALGPAGWQEITASPKPSPRNFYAMSFDNGSNSLVLFGGNTANGPMNDVWLFSSAAGAWRQVGAEGEAPKARFGHDAVWLEGSRSFLVFGGSDGSRDMNDLWELRFGA